MTIILASEMLSLRAISESELAICAIINSAEFRLHDLVEKRIDEIEQAFAAAEVFGQREGPTPGRPLLFIFKEDRRLRLSKAVDALLHIANEEAVRCSAGVLACGFK